MDRLAGWAVPHGAVRAPAPSAVEDIREWFDALGVVIPQPAPMALRWTADGCEEVPVDEAVEDADLVLSSEAMAAYHPDLDSLAAGCASIVAEHHQQYPGPLSWRRWELTGKVARLLYRSGVTRSGGSVGYDGRDPIGGPVFGMPRLRDVWPRRNNTMRPYLLWLPSWWWECQARQGWKVRGRHRPEAPFAFGVCAACCPCPSCGAHRECLARCEL